MYETLKYEVRDNIAFVTVNRPKAMNALNSQVLDELYCVFYEICKDDSVLAVVLTGEGKAFVAGADIAEMSKLGTVEARTFAHKGHNVMNFIENLNKPVIAAVNGFALGGGCELSMACDIRLASAKAKFGQPEVGLGLIPGFGGNLRLPRLVGKGMAKYLIFSADMIDAQEAHRIGLVERVCEPEELMAEAEALAKKIAAKAPIAVSVAKDVINNGYDADMKTASAYEVNAFGISFASEDMKEGTSAFLEKRKAEFKNR
ncbi:MAG: enoyl-CoA hydratase-related protein [Bacillota bacterium]|nr:enoyl-CoA hydratase-related protein [Bacillota bacterium]